MKSAPSNLSICKIFQENKNAKFWEKKNADSGISGLEFESNIVIFEIRTLNFVPLTLQNLAEKEKCLNLGPTMSYLAICGQEI